MLSQILPLGNLRRNIPKTSLIGKKKAEARPERIQRKDGGSQAGNQDRKHKRNRGGLSKYA